MKRTLLSLTIICACIFTSKAQMSQGEFTFGAGIHVALPTGNLSTISSFGLGAEIQAEYGIQENLSGVGTVGFTNFFGKSVDLGGGYSYKYPSTNQVPILVGARFYPSEQVFVGAQIGVGIFNNSLGTGFEYRPQVGYNMDQFQFILMYDGASVSGGSVGHVGLSAIYKFGGGK